MTTMLDDPRIDSALALGERLVIALERIVARLSDPDQAVTARLADLEEMLTEVVSTIEDPLSTDRDWGRLHKQVKAVLGVV